MDQAATTTKARVKGGGGGGGVCRSSIAAVSLYGVLPYLINTNNIQEGLRSGSLTQLSNIRANLLTSLFLGCAVFYLLVNHLLREESYRPSSVYPEDLIVWRPNPSTIVCDILARSIVESYGYPSNGVQCGRFLPYCTVRSVCGGVP